MVPIAACAAGDPSSAGPVSAASIEALIGDAACDSDAQCHTVAVGAKACGGPQRYLAWSSQRTDGATLRSVAEREALAARAKVESSGVMSNCAMVTDPGAYCAAPEAAGRSAAPGASARAAAGRQCVVRASGLGGAAKIY
jgi:hypothetical protein